MSIKWWFYEFVIVLVYCFERDAKLLYKILQQYLFPEAFLQNRRLISTQPCNSTTILELSIDFKNIVSNYYLCLLNAVVTLLA